MLIVHLLKGKCQPEKQSASWRATIATQRSELELLLEDSPSLRRAVAASAENVYPTALQRASIETGLPAPIFPRECPFSPDQLLNRAFLPE